MDVLTLSRLQFAVTTGFHFLFVPLTLGLSLLVALLELLWVRTRDPDYLTATRFFGKLFLINFAVGVVTGIPLEFQFGTNWARYARFTGDVFGPLLAIEATAAFFLESTFIAVWFFGWKKLSPSFHCVTIWLVTIASNLSAFWIIAANSWMQHPVGYVIRQGRAELTDFLAVITQKFVLTGYLHTVAGAWILGGFFMLGICAWHLGRGNRPVLFQKVFRLAAGWTLLSCLLGMATGHFSATLLSTVQPVKLAAMESLWKTSSDAPMHLVLWPDAARGKNTIEALTLPGALSFLAHGNFHEAVQGLDTVPAIDRPPVLPVFLAFRLMLGCGMLLLTVAIWAFLRRRNLTGSHLPRLLPWLIPLPYLVNLLGWTVTEVGRQPWLVYGVLRTEHGVSEIAAGQVFVSLGGLILVCALLGGIDFWLLLTHARKIPPTEGSSHA